MLTLFNNIYVTSFKKFHEETVDHKIYSELMTVLVRGHASSPYNNTGIHLLEISCKITSSDAYLPILPNNALAAR